MVYEQRTGSTHQWRLLRKRAATALPLRCSNPKCGKPLNLEARRGSEYAAELDHIVPKKVGGLDVLENVQWMCSPCNRRKSDRTPEPTPHQPRTFVTHRTWTP